MEKTVAVILAGGYGVRLWPISNEKNPKQFNNFVGEGSLISNTYHRLLNFFERDDIYIVTQTFFFDKILRHIPDVKLSNLILEPYVRNTAAAITYAYYNLQKKYPADTTCFVFPSDHHISNLYEFGNSLEIAKKSADELKGIITLGIKPDNPNTQYGYIQLDEGRFMQNELYEMGVRWVRTFAEKPDAKTAERFLQAGDFIWNSGIFAFNLEIYENELFQHLPNFYQVFSKLADLFDKPNFAEQLDIAYRSITPTSFDNGILEKSKRVFCVVSNFEWSDISSWDELYRLLMKDASGNHISGEVVSVNTHNSLIISRDRLVATYDIDNLIIVETPTSTFICKRGSSLGIKSILEQLNAKGINEYL